MSWFHVSSKFFTFRSQRNYFERPKIHQRNNENTLLYCLGQIIVWNVLNSRLNNRVCTVSRTVSWSRHRFRMVYSCIAAVQQRAFKRFGTVSRWVGTTMTRPSGEFYSRYTSWKKILRTLTVTLTYLGTHAWSPWVPTINIIKRDWIFGAISMFQAMSVFTRPDTAYPVIFKSFGVYYSYKYNWVVKNRENFVCKKNHTDYGNRRIW